MNTLHSSRDPEDLRQLLQAGADANGRNDNGQTPLMNWRSAEENRILLAGGADPNARDRAGQSVLDHQSGYTCSAIGYCAPDFAALDVLLEAGATPPTVDQGERWIESARGAVTAACEHNDAVRFEEWVRRVATG